MSFSDETLSCIHDRTSGYCHLCWRKVCFRNYGIIGARGAWEVEHSVDAGRDGPSQQSVCGMHPLQSRQGDNIHPKSAGLEWPLPSTAISHAKTSDPKSER